MAAQAHSTPAPDADAATERQRRDAEMASAYFDLETPIADLKRVAALMEMAAERTVFRTECHIAETIHNQMGLQGYHIHIFTEDQSDGLDYAIRHTFELIKALYKKYYELEAA